MPLGFVLGLWFCGAGVSFAGAGFGGVLGAIGLQEGWPHLIKQLFDFSAVGQSALESWHHGHGNVLAPPFSLAGEGQKVVGVFLAGGTGRAVGANAGFVDQRQRAFDCRPQAGQLLEKLLGKGGRWMFLLHKIEYSMAVCIYTYMLNYNPKKPSDSSPG